MSITDELREYVNKTPAPKSRVLMEARDRFNAIADRIDAEHERLMQEQPYTIDMVPMTDESMAEHGWVRLPKDADGEYIQPSDIPHLTKANDGKRLAYCPPLSLRQDGTWVIAGWPTDRYRISKPTVEDVLMELLNEAEHFHSLEEERDAIAQYAAKLRLAGDEE